jgi:hypothetical protein
MVLWKQMEAEPESKKQKTGEGKDLPTLLLEWAGGREHVKEHWKGVLETQFIFDVEALKKLAAGNRWEDWIKDIKDHVLATYLEEWKKATFPPVEGDLFVLSLPLRLLGSFLLLLRFPENSSFSHGLFFSVTGVSSVECVRRKCSLCTQ